MKYLGCFIKEVLRAAPPLSGTVCYRNWSGKDVTIDDDVTIRAGDYVASCILSLNYDPKQW